MPALSLKSYPHVATPAPQFHPAAHAVDEFVGLDAVLGPGIKGQLLLALFPGTGDGHKVLALAAARRDLVGDALFGEAKVEPGFLKGRVDDRVGDYDTFDFHSLQTRALANQVGFDQSPSHRFDGGRAALNPYRCH